VWHGRAGAPWVAGFRVSVPAGGEDPVVREVPTAYVRPFAHAASARLAEQGRLRAGDELRWVVSAFPIDAGVDAAEEPARPRDGFTVEEVVEALAVGETPLAELFERAQLAGAGDPGAGVPVFVPRGVLDEIEALALAAGDVETGGVLIGRLHRDTGATPGDLFMEVTAQLPAEHAVSRATRLTFTPATWAAAAAALALRKRGELVAGWWHAHPAFCVVRGCPPERRRDCALSRAFFSSEDVHLHATCFGAAHHVALLLSDGVSDARRWTLYGWSHGMVAERDFHVLTSSQEGADDVSTRAG
jgi:hypothetical protein